MQQLMSANLRCPYKYQIMDIYFEGITNFIQNQYNYQGLGYLLVEFLSQYENWKIYRMPEKAYQLVYKINIDLNLVKVKKVLQTLYIQQFNNMAKGRKKNHGNDSDSEQLEDVMAWGNKKQNYYRDDENSYSEASEQYQEAQQIYRKQHQDLNNQQFYQYGAEESDRQVEEQGQSDEQEIGTKINDEYIQKQIVWCSQLSQLFEGINDDKSKYRNNVCNNYLMILLCLKQFKNIPYLEHHPMVQNMAYLRKGLIKLQNQFQNIAMNDQNEIDQQDQYNQQISGQNQQQGINFQQDQQYDQFDEDEQGIKIYEQIKASNQKLKSQKKKIQKLKRDQQLKKVKAFKTVTESEGRLASQKIVKNKGLMKRRKKIDGNSRVKLRQKYRKAQIKLRTKGKIGVKENPGRYYEGQKKISAGKIASTKL